MSLDSYPCHGVSQPALRNTAMKKGYLSYEGGSPVDPKSTCIDYTHPGEDSVQMLWIPNHLLDEFGQAIKLSKETGVSLYGIKITTCPPFIQEPSVTNVRIHNLKKLAVAFDLTTSFELRPSEVAAVRPFRNQLHFKLVDAIMDFRMCHGGLGSGMMPRLASANLLSLPLVVDAVSGCVNVDEITAGLIQGAGNILYPGVIKAVPDDSLPAGKTRVVFDTNGMDGLGGALLSESLDVALISQCCIQIANSLPDDPIECFRVLHSQSRDHVPGDTWDKLGLICRAVCWWRLVETGPMHTNHGDRCPATVYITNAFLKVMQCTSGPRSSVSDAGSMITPYADWPLTWWCCEWYRGLPDCEPAWTNQRTATNAFDPGVNGYACFSGCTPTNVADVIGQALGDSATQEMRDAVMWNTRKQTDLSKVRMWRVKGQMEDAGLVMEPASQLHNVQGTNPSDPANANIEWLNILADAMARLDLIQVDVAMDRLTSGAGELQLTKKCTRGYNRLLPNDPDVDIFSALQVVIGQVMVRYMEYEASDTWPIDTRELLADGASTFSVSSKIVKPYKECINTVVAHLLAWLNKDRVLLSGVKKDRQLPRTPQCEFIHLLFFCDRDAAAAWLDYIHLGLRDGGTKPATDFLLRYWLFSSALALQGSDCVGTKEKDFFASAGLPHPRVNYYEMCGIGDPKFAFDTYGRCPMHYLMLNRFMAHSSKPEATMAWYCSNHGGNVLRMAMAPDMVDWICPNVGRAHDSYMTAGGVQPGDRIYMMMCALSECGKPDMLARSDQLQLDWEHPGHVKNLEKPLNVDDSSAIEYSAQELTEFEAARRRAGTDEDMAYSPLRHNHCRGTSNRVEHAERRRESRVKMFAALQNRREERAGEGKKGGGNGKGRMADWQAKLRRNSDVLREWIDDHSTDGADMPDDRKELTTMVEMIDEFIELYDGAVEAAVWKDFIRASQRFKERIAQHRAKLKEDEKLQREQAVQVRILAQRDAEYDGLVVELERTRDKSLVAWTVYVDSQYTNQDACDEAITRVRTAKKKLVPRLDQLVLIGVTNPRHERPKEDCITALTHRESHIKERKRQGRSRVVDSANSASSTSSTSSPLAAEPSCDTVGGTADVHPPVASATAVPTIDWESPGVKALDRATKKKLAKGEITLDSVWGRIVDEGLRVAAERASLAPAQEETPPPPPIRDATASGAYLTWGEAIERSRQELEEARARGPPAPRGPGRSFMLRRVSHVGPNGHESQRFSSDKRDWAAERLYQAERRLQQEQQPAVMPLASVGTLPSAPAKSDDLTSVATGLACCICMIKARTHAIIPCGHKCICADCAKIALPRKECPLCRKKVQHICEIFD